MGESRRTGYIHLSRLPGKQWELVVRQPPQLLLYPLFFLSLAGLFMQVVVPQVVRSEGRIARMRKHKLTRTRGAGAYRFRCEPVCFTQ